MPGPTVPPGRRPGHRPSPQRPPPEPTAPGTGTTTRTHRRPPPHPRRVQHPVVTGGHDRRDGEQRVQQPEALHPPPGRDDRDDDPAPQRPSEVQRGHGRVLVGQGGERAVVRLGEVLYAVHGVDDPQPRHEPRRCQRIEPEPDEGQQGRETERGPGPPVVPRPPPVQQGQHAQRHHEVEGLVVEVEEVPQPVDLDHRVVGPVLDVDVQQALEVEDLPAVLFGGGPPRGVGSAGGRESDLLVGGVGDTHQQQFEEQIGPGQHPPQERQQRHAPQPRGHRRGVRRGDRRPVVRRGPRQEGNHRGGGERGQQHHVVPQGVQRRDVRQHHRRREGHHHDDGHGPHVPVGGALADPPDDREQHPQQLVLPGGRRDGDRRAPGDRDGEQQLAVAGIAHGPPHAQRGDGRAEGQEEGDLQRSGHTQTQQQAVQGLVGEVVGGTAEAGARDVVHPVGVGVVRHRGPGQRGAGGEGRGRGQGAPATAGEPEQGREEQDRGLEGGGETDEQAAEPLTPHGEAGDQDQQDRHDAGLPEVERVAHGQRQHEQADRDRRGEQGGTAVDRLGQGAGGDEAEGDDQEQGAEGPAPAESLFGGPGERLQDKSPERGTRELRRVVQRALHMQDTVRADPGLQVRQPLASGGTEGDGHLSDGEDGGHQPQGQSGRAQPRLDLRSPTVLRIRHASSASQSRSCHASERKDAGNPRFT